MMIFPKTSILHTLIFVHKFGVKSIQDEVHVICENTCSISVPRSPDQAERTRVEQPRVSDVPGAVGRSHENTSARISLDRPRLHGIQGSCCPDILCPRRWGHIFNSNTSWSRGALTACRFRAFLAAVIGRPFISGLHPSRYGHTGQRIERQSSTIREAIGLRVLPCSPPIQRMHSL